MESLIEDVRRRLAEDQQVRRSLPANGRLAIDRPLPFLCVYRRPAKTKDQATDRLVTSEASYLVCSSGRKQQEEIGLLAKAVTEELTERFGRILILEIWAGNRREASAEDLGSVLRPTFKVFAPKTSGTEKLTDDFDEALQQIKVGSERAEVKTVDTARRWPRGLPPIIPADQAEEIGCLTYGLEVGPVFFDPETGKPYPWILNQLRRKLSTALRRFFYKFAKSSTRADPAHFHVLGRRAVVKAVWDSDKILAETAESFQFLLQLTPINGEQAWYAFQRSKFQKHPAFHYRPQLSDPTILKRHLYRAPVERIEDPSLALVFRQRQDEIDRQITMLQDRNTRRFLPESIQLFGTVDDDLHDLAIDLLQRIPPRSREGSGSVPGLVDAETFAQRARQEIAYLQEQRPEVTARVEVRPDVTGLLVSRGNLLINSKTRVPASRVDALIQHEVGTHVLTYHNGQAQRLRLLSAGFAGYDALQEGLAVLTEYLVGGLSRPRLRLLAGRVVAARCLLDGASFIDTYRTLHNTYGFANRTAFTVTVRTHRSGGLTKDSVYLLGLQQILEYIRKGGDLEPLFVGKIAIEHIPIVRELTWRKVLVQPPLIPRYMSQPDSRVRLDRLRLDTEVIDLLKG